MPRQAREESGTGIFHVMMRGINHQAIFEDEEDYYQFINTHQGNTLDIEHNQQTIALQGQKHNFSSKHSITFWGVYIKS